MANKESACRVAIKQLLADGEWHNFEDALKVGAAQVSSDRALKEMRDKQSGQPEERRVATGQRNVAHQALSGLIRFRQVKSATHDGVKQVQARTENPADLDVDVLLERLKVAEAKVDGLNQTVEAVLPQLDYLMSRLEGETVTPPAQSAREVYDAEVAPLLS